MGKWLIVLLMVVVMFAIAGAAIIVPEDSAILWLCDVVVGLSLGTFIATS